MKNVQIGIIGLGAMGKGLVYQTQITKGIRTVAVCDSDIKKACAVLEEFGIAYAVANSPLDADSIIAAGKTVVFECGGTLADAGGMDAVVEATGSIIQGGEHCVRTLVSGKHLVLMNSEADLIYGPYLSRLADENNVVCTSIDGDQYGVLKHLIDDLALWGFDLVMAGNMKGFLDRYANPDSIIHEADIRNLDYKACTSYTDGTKLNIEMALIANALGLVTAVPGMHGPACGDIADISSVFDFEALWQARKPFVDYVLGAKPGGGVFAIGYCDNPYQREMMKYYKMGDGPFYTFYRPYHLCHVEAMASVMNAVLKNETLLRPEAGFKTNVYAYAKKNLKAGDKLDGIGGYACYGLIENCADQGSAPGIPICLADGVFIQKDIKKDERIFFADIAFDPVRTDFELFALAQGE